MYEKEVMELIEEDPSFESIFIQVIRLEMDYVLKRPGAAEQRMRAHFTQILQNTKLIERKVVLCELAKERKEPLYLGFTLYELL